MKVFVQVLDENGKQIGFTSFDRTPDRLEWNLISAGLRMTIEDAFTPQIKDLPKGSAEYDGLYLVRAGSEGSRIFGAMVKEMRLTTDFTAGELAEKVGVHVSFIHGIERGAQAPSMQTARAILDVLPDSYSYTWLVTRLCDLVISDPEQGNIGFKFQAEVQGQNRRG